MLNTDTLDITNTVLKLVSELDEFKGAWQAIGPARSSPFR